MQNVHLTREEMLAWFPGEEHQHAQRGDFGVADAREPGHPGGRECQLGDVRRGLADVAAFEEDRVANEAGEINAVEGCAALAGLIGFDEEGGFGIEAVGAKPGSRMRCANVPQRKR
jgi:hypothetical protein